MRDDIPTKVVVTVAEMARMVGLSRARFYQLQKAEIFPAALRDPSTNRPYYDEELQKVCLEVRRRNCGINGKPILFYARRHDLSPPSSRPRRAKAPPAPKQERHDDLLDGLKSLGLTTATMVQVEEAVGELYPQGTADMDQAELLRVVFLHLRRRDSGDKVG